MVSVAATSSGPAYEVRIGGGLIDRMGVEAEPFLSSRRVCVVSDTNVSALHGARTRAALRAAGYEPVELTVAAGEGSKNWQELERVVEWLLSQGLSRNDAVIAFGGGVIGDLVGFACSMVKRGCKVVQVPTTLLSQVDSSVGGKTAINAAAGKNLVGAFHQPALVLADLDVLATLDERQMRAGYAEIVKVALVQDAAFFYWLEAHGPAVLAREPGALRHAIETSVAAKARIVEEDARETTGRRALLNLGHTFGHALEADAGFGDSLLHGEAVAVGTVLAARYSSRIGRLDASDAERIEAHLQSIGMRTRLAEVSPQAAPSALVAHMSNDKKRVGETLPFVLLDAIGSGVLDRCVALADVEAFLTEEHHR